MNRNIALIFCFGLIMNYGYSQNKKEQIEVLNFSIDSLENVNANLKIFLSEKDKLIFVNDGLIKKNEQEISELKNTIDNNNKTIWELNANISTLQKNYSELILLNDQLKKTIDSLNSSLKSKQITKYSFIKIEGRGANCNCGCDAEKQADGNWEYLGTWACELPKCSGSKIINDYFNSFCIILDQDEIIFKVEDKDAIKGKLLNQPVKNKQTILYKSDSSKYVFREVNDEDCDPFAILFGTLDSITDIIFIQEINNSIQLTFSDGGSDYSLFFQLINPF